MSFSSPTDTIARLRSQREPDGGSCGKQRTIPSMVMAAKVEKESPIGPSISTRAGKPDLAYPYCGYLRQLAVVRWGASTGAGIGAYQSFDALCVS